MQEPADLGFGEMAFFDGAQGLWPAYLALRGHILGMFPGCEVRVHGTQLSFRAPRPFAWVWRLPGARGRASFFLTFATDHGGPLAHETQAVYIRPGHWTRHLAVTADGPQAMELTDYIAASHRLRNRKGGAS
ncbi:MAG TPA: DUF5655 domain-containing protein [Candidatus Limnocylindria bacterium]|nr:DUF5655 domain-containing protein [Candidatus Limnocylindria bacterium]